MLLFVPAQAEATVRTAMGISSPSSTFFILSSPVTDGSLSLIARTSSSVSDPAAVGRCLDCYYRPVGFDLSCLRRRRSSTLLLFELNARSFEATSTSVSAPSSTVASSLPTASNRSTRFPPSVLFWLAKMFFVARPWPALVGERGGSFVGERASFSRTKFVFFPFRTRLTSCRISACTLACDIHRKKSSSNFFFEHTYSPRFAILTMLLSPLALCPIVSTVRLFPDMCFPRYELRLRVVRGTASDTLVQQLVSRGCGRL